MVGLGRGRSPDQTQQGLHEVKLEQSDSGLEVSFCVPCHSLQWQVSLVEYLPAPPSKGEGNKRIEAESMFLCLGHSPHSISPLQRAQIPKLVSAPARSCAHPSGFSTVPCSYS